VKHAPSAFNSQGGRAVLEIPVHNSPLDAAGMLADSTVRILFTGDEENPGSPTEVARRDLVDTARQSDVALSFESDSGKIAIGRRGLSTWDLDVTGAGGHSANVLRPRRGAGAIYEASRILNRFREAFSESPNVTVNPGLFLGGTDVAYDPHERRGTSAGKFNVVARAATILGDLRFLTEAERTEAQSKMREIAASNLTRTSVRLTFDDMVPGWPASDANRAVLQVIDEVSLDLGYGPVEADDPGSRGFGDFNFIGSVVPGADGLGVRGRGEHGPDETMDLTSLLPCTARAAVVIARLLRQRDQTGTRSRP
jgi:glutamate carboxypeptidase